MIFVITNIIEVILLFYLLMMDDDEEIYQYLCIE